MADNRLKNLKIDDKKLWLQKYDEIIDDIYSFYHRIHPISEVVFNYILKTTIDQATKKEEPHDFLIRQYIEDIFQIIKFFPLLLVLEKYELMQKSINVISYLKREKIEQAKMLHIGISIEHFADILEYEKDAIIESATKL